MECPVIVHYLVDLQSVHGLRCYDDVARNAKCQRLLVIALCPVKKNSSDCCRRKCKTGPHTVSKQKRVGLTVRMRWTAVPPVWFSTTVRSPACSNGRSTLEHDQSCSIRRC